MIDFNDILSNQNDDTLREYQTQAKAAIYNAWINSNRVMLQMPTGAGKTRIFTSIVKDIHNQSARIKKALKVLILVHRQELVNQASRTLGEKYNIAHGIIMSKFYSQKFYPTQIASIQTLIRRLDQWRSKEFDVIIVDEAHHSLAKSYLDIFRAYPHAKVLGVTATPYRLNGEGFNTIYDEFVETKSVSQFIKEGHLSHYDYFSIKPTSYVKRKINAIDDFDVNGDYSIQSMMRILSEPKIRSNIIESYKKHAAGLKGIVYTINKHHNLQVCEDYKEAGFLAAAIDSDTKSEIRESIISKFKNGKIDILCNVNIFSEGFDCPDIEFIQLARPTKSLSMYLQQVGRGLRLGQGLGSVVIIDNVGLYNDFGLPSIIRNWYEHFCGTANGINRELESSSDEVALKYMDDIIEGNEETILIEQQEHLINLGATFDYFINDVPDLQKFLPFEFDDIMQHVEVEMEEEEEDYLGYKHIRNRKLVEKGGKVNLIEGEKLEPLFSTWFDNIDKPNALGFSKVLIDTKLGIIDLNKNTQTVNCQFESLDCLSYLNRHGEYLAETDNKLGIITNQGRIIVPIAFDDVYPTNKLNNVYIGEGEGWKVYENDEGLIDEYDHFLNTTYFKIVTYKSQFAIWSKKAKNLIHPFIYSSIEEVGPYYLAGMSNGWSTVYGVFDNKLNTIVPIKYNNVSILNNKYIKYQGSVEKDGVWHQGFGLFDQNGETIFKPMYQDIDVHQDTFVVRIENEWKVLNKDHEVISKDNNKSIAIKKSEELKSIVKSRRKRPRIKKN